MKRLMLVALLLAVLAPSLAAPHRDFSNIVQNFAYQRGLTYQPAASTAGAGAWTYVFASANETLAVNFNYTPMGGKCVYPTSLFGDLPMQIKNRPALFSIASITDRAAQTRDTLIFDDGQGGCYELSYGFKGAHFKDLKILANQLLD